MAWPEDALNETAPTPTFSSSELGQPQNALVCLGDVPGVTIGRVVVAHVISTGLQAGERQLRSSQRDH